MAGGSGSFRPRQIRYPATCGTTICGYRYRFHPAESPLFERCIGLAWCSGCGIYMATMVYVSRDEALTDALVELPADWQEQLKRSECKLVEYLASQDLGEGQAGR